MDGIGRSRNPPRGPERQALGHPPGLAPATAARVIVMGDSIGTGTGASDRARRAYDSLLRLNDDATWPGFAAVDLESRLGATPELVNVAAGGATTSSMRRFQLAALQARLPAPVRGHSIVLITIGGNDLQAVIGSRDPTGRPLADAIANLRAAIEWLQRPAMFPDCVSIYLMDVYDPTDGTGYARGCFSGATLPGLAAALDAWRDAYVQLGTELGVAVIDALGHFHGHGKSFDRAANPHFHAADPSPWLGDCIHPNDRGHHELRRLFFEAIDGTYRVAD